MAVKVLDNKLRKKVEKLIFDTFDALDKTGENTNHYREIFAKMNNNEFLKFISLKFPYRFYYKPFKTEPNMKDIYDGLAVLNVPVLEKVSLPYYYKNKDGVPVNTKECYVLYLHLKKMQQFITKKNGMSIDLSTRDMRTGLLTGYDKNGMSSDREMEAMMVAGLDDTMKEFSTYKADSMDAKNAMYNTISAKGSVSFKDVPVDNDDSLSRNLINAYLLGSLIQTNIINEDYYLPITLKNKKREIGRE